MKEQFLDLNDVAEQFGVSVGFIKRAVKEGTFPRPIQLGKRKKFWVQSILDEHMEELIDEAKNGTTDPWEVS